MKKYFYKAIPALFMVAFLSCTSDNEFGNEQSTKGLNFRMVPDKQSFDLAAGDPALTFTMYTENNDIDFVTVDVELLFFANDSLSERRFVTEIDGSSLSNDGNSKVSLSLSDFTSALGLSNSDLNGGDIFTIYNVVTLQDGRSYPDSITLGEQKFVNVENGLITASATTSLTTNLTFPVLCPFIIAEAEGTYAITRDDLGIAYDANHQPEVIPGPEPNQVIIKDMLGHPEAYDILVEVNPSTDVATVKQQQAWNSANFGLPYGVATVEGTGFYFSCTGFLTLELENKVSAGSFGKWKIEFTKIP